MKILAFVDMHGNKSIFDRIIKKTKNVDLVICAGDLTNFGIDLDKFLLKLDKIGKLVLIIHGNHESEEEFDIVKKFKNIKYIHKKKYDINNYRFYGFGGGGFSQIEEKLEEVIKKFNKDNKKIILVTHAPVYNTKIDFIHGIGHVGNISVRKFITKIKPVLVICGHLHETDSILDKIEKTRIINPGKEGKIITI